MLDKIGDSAFPVSEDSQLVDKDPVTRVPTTELTAPAAAMPMWLRLLLGVLQAALMVAILLGSFMLAKKMIDDKPEPRKRRAFKTVYTIDTVTVKQTDYQPVISSYGQIVAARSVELRALVSGEIVKVNPKLRAGAKVSKGESLIEIDTFNYKGALAEAEANLVEANARITENEAQISLEKGKLFAANEQLQLALADFKRLEALKKRQAATQQQLEIRKLVVSQRKQSAAVAEDTIEVQQARIEQLRASLLRLQWRVDQAQRNLESTTLTAPFDGIVRSSTAELGRAITANDVVVSMYEADTMEVKFTLTDAEYGRLSGEGIGFVGRKVKVIWSVGGNRWEYPATIDRAGAEITSTRGGVELFALIENTPGALALRPGAFVEVAVPDRIFPGTFIVPDTSVYSTNTVYTVVDGKLVENPVDIVAFEGENALIESGLKEGDEVLVTRITEVSAGLNVRREGDAAKRPDSAAGRGGKNAGADAAQPGARRPGPPSPEEIARVAKANGLSVAEFRALERPEQRKMIGAHRASGQAGD